MILEGVVIGVPWALAMASGIAVEPDAASLAPVAESSGRSGEPHAGPGAPADVAPGGGAEAPGPGGPVDVVPGEGAGDSSTDPEAGADVNAGTDADAGADGDAELRTKPASLPSLAPTAPASAEPHAYGGAYDAPLPPAPSPEDPAGLTDDPWRGRFWLGIALHLSIPVGGTRPGAGNVVAPVPEVAVGWRVRPWLGLQTSISNFSHDAVVTQDLDAEGREVQEVIYGRITAFDLLTARLYWPRPRRVEPWAELGAGVGVRRSPLDVPLEAAGLFRVGMGVDLWLAPTFSLRPEVGYRLNIIDRTVGHGLRAGLSLGVHW